MGRRGRATIATVLGSLLLTAASTPGVHASGGPGGGSGANCHPVVGGHAGATSPVPIAENAVVDCPFASGPTGTPTGPSSSRGGPGPYKPGDPCSYVIYRPVKIQVDDGGHVTEFDPLANGSFQGGFGYPPDLAPVPVTTQQGNDIYMPYKFSGTADANGNCTVGVKSTLGCPDPVPFTNFVVAGNICWQTFPHAAVGGGLTPGQIAPFIDVGRVAQFINVGTVASLPDNPHEGLVNVGTCFFLNGATFAGLGGAPQPITQPAFYTMSVAQPLNDGTGRFIFYVFRIEVALSGVGLVWDFGDGSTTPDTDLPGPCASVPATVRVSHTYRKYGTFQVTITENFDVTVEEFWEDANGDHGPVLVPGVVPPITRVLPIYAKTIIQEEGVPRGGS